MRGVDVEAIRAEGMDQAGLHMRPALAGTAVAPAALAAAGLRQVAVHADEEHIDVCEQPGQVLAPGAELDEVLGDQVMSCPGQRGQALVKPAVPSLGARRTGLTRTADGAHVTAGVRNALGLVSILHRWNRKKRRLPGVKRNSAHSPVRPAARPEIAARRILEGNASFQRS